MATLTTVYEFYLPVIGGDIDVWGGFHNDNFEKLDDLLSGVQLITPNLTEGAWKIGGVAVTPSAAELNVLNGFTGSTADLNLLDAYTGNSADLNILSGAAGAGLTAAELLYVNGVTSAIQTQLDGKQPLDTLLTDLSDLGDTLVAGDLLYATGVNNVARFPKGDALDFLRMDATGTNFEWVPGGLTNSAVETADSVNPFEFDGIPADVKRITVCINNMSLNAATPFLLQLKVSGAYVTTGYTSWGNAQGGSGTVTTSSSAGFVSFENVASRSYTGVFTLIRMTSNTWMCFGVGFSGAEGRQTSGIIPLAADVEGLRIIGTGGGVPDSGNAAILWEY